MVVYICKDRIQTI